MQNTTLSGGKSAEQIFRFLYAVLISVLLFVTSILTIGYFVKSSNLDDCGFDSCVSTNCTSAMCNSGVCVETPIDGCCENPDDCALITPGIYNYGSMFVKNITGLNATNSIDDSLTINGVTFANSTMIFDCYLSPANCPLALLNVTFTDAVYVNSLLQNNQQFVKINNILSITNNFVMNAAQAALQIYYLNVSGTFCTGNISACGGSLSINGFNITNGTFNIDTLNVQTFAADSLIIEISQSFNLTQFILGNTTAQAVSSAGNYTNVLFNPNGGNVGINIEDPDDIDYLLHVNGTTAATTLTFIGDESDPQPENDFMSAFEYYLLNTTFYGPWAANFSKNLVINLIGQMVFVEFPEFNETSIRNSSIYSTRPIPTRFLMGANYSSSDFFEEEIAVVSDENVNGRPGIFRIYGDGTFLIQATLTTDLSNTTTGELPSGFVAGLPAGIKGTSVNWVFKIT